MLPTNKFFVPREEILKLTSNSFEHRAVKIEAVVKQEKQRLFDNAEPQVLGTFDKYAVILTDAGKVYRVQYEEAASGNLHLLSATLMNAAVYPREAMPSYLRKEAKAAADLFLKGMVGEANKKISQLAKLMDETTVYEDDKIVDPLLASIVSTRMWKQAIGEKTDADLKQVLGESYGKIDSQKLRAKFFKLYDGSMQGSELEKYRGLVNEDVGHLMGRMDVVFDQALKSVGTLREFSEKVRDDERETVSAFVAFVEDLAEDVRQVKKTVAETLQGVDSVSSLGRLYDTLAEELLRYEIAGGFAVQMTTRLATASR